MQAIQQLILSYPPDQLLWYLGGIIFLTALGVIPNNLDLTIVVTGLLAGTGLLHTSSLVLITIAALLLGETLTFLIGYHLGNKLFQNKFIQKKISNETLLQYSSLIDSHPKKLQLLMRITPGLKPIIMFSYGSLRPKIFKFLSSHYAILIIFVSFVIYLSAFIGSELKPIIETNKVLFFTSYIVVWFSVLKFTQQKIKAAL